jgi:hypothetical protein
MAPPTLRNQRLSASELCASLAPYVPAPPEEQVVRAVAAYQASGNVGALVRAVHRLQPALLPAAIAKVCNGTSVQVAMVPAVLREVLPSCPLAEQHVALYTRLMVLDSGQQTLEWPAFLLATNAAADATKRASAIARYVAAAQGLCCAVALLLDAADLNIP